MKGPRIVRSKYPFLSNKDWLQQKYERDLLSLTEIGKIVGCNQSVVAWWLIEHEISYNRGARISRIMKESQLAQEQRIQARHNSKPSNLQLMLGDVLRTAGYDLETEVRFGNYHVDFYSPSRHVAFEADGSYHGLESHIVHDSARDSWLMNEYELPVIRFNTTEIRRLYAADS